MSELPGRRETTTLDKYAGPRHEWIGLPLGCSKCILPEGYAGAEFQHSPDGGSICNFCADHTEPTFLGGKQLIADLDLEPDEKVGVTVSGGKDGLTTWTWLADTFGPDRVVAFNHEKLGLVHPLATQNLDNAARILGSRLVRVTDTTMLPRFRRNLEALLDYPDPAMVRVALCAGCRVGISGQMFQAGRELGITKFVNAASYLELAPFKSAIMKAKGSGNERRGLLCGLQENPGYAFGDNLKIIDLDDRHNQKSQLAGGGSSRQYPDIKFLDFDSYFPNIPEQNEELVTRRLGWARPERSWHFDCLIETFKDAFYYGKLGYTETDGHLSAQVRHSLMSRDAATDELLKARGDVIDGLPVLEFLMDNLGVGHLKGRMADFYSSSTFLNVPR